MSRGLCACGCGPKARERFAPGRNGLARDGVDRRDQVNARVRRKKSDKAQARTEQWYRTEVLKIPGIEGLGMKK
jgi:hypothetical protein